MSHNRQIFIGERNEKGSDIYNTNNKTAIWHYEHQMIYTEVVASPPSLIKINGQKGHGIFPSSSNGNLLQQKSLFVQKKPSYGVSRQNQA